jgi:uncharacterized integral membrane protein
LVRDLGGLFVRGEFVIERLSPRAQSILLTLMWFGFAAGAWLLIANA